MGLAAGDAVGTAVEFRPRGSFPPLVDMTGGGPFGLEPGQWTDDTSLALCLAASLVERKGFDPADQMERYWRWYQEGYLSSTGKFFDIGNTVHAALNKYHDTGDPYAGPTTSTTAGNGSIMRLAPIPMFYFADPLKVEYYAAESSRTTHGALECVDACRLLSRIIWRALAGKVKNEVLNADRLEFEAAPKIIEIAKGEYQTKPMDDIHGTGFVVESLEAALWCFYATDSYEEAVLMAANLGDDADTTAAVCGQVAGAYYGVEGIPAKWLENLALRDMISNLAEQIFLHNHLA